MSAKNVIFQSKLLKLNSTSTGSLLLPANHHNLQTHPNPPPPPKAPHQSIIQPRQQQLDHQKTIAPTQRRGTRPEAACTAASTAAISRKLHRDRNLSTVQSKPLLPRREDQAAAAVGPKIATPAGRHRDILFLRSARRSSGGKICACGGKARKLGPRDALLRCWQAFKKKSARSRRRCSSPDVSCVIEAELIFEAGSC